MKFCLMNKSKALTIEIDPLLLVPWPVVEPLDHPAEEEVLRPQAALGGGGRGHFAKETAKIGAENVVSVDVVPPHNPGSLNRRSQEQNPHWYLVVPGIANPPTGLRCTST